MLNVKTVAVIGAGAGGLTAIKCCLDEGLSPTCFERSSELGGLWYYTAGGGRVCVYPTMTTNNSKEMMAYSDFPMPKHHSSFMHHSHILAYLKSYAATFDLEKYITYNQEVILVKPATDYDSTGRWTVEVKDLKSGKVKTSTFDAVLVCNGLNTQTHWPDIPGLKSFKGRVFHGIEHMGLEGYERKRVVVVGLGHTGSDVALDASRTARKVFLATRDGEWTLSKCTDVGLPFDMSFFRRANGGLFGGKQTTPNFNHVIYHAIPKGTNVDFRRTKIIMTDELEARVMDGYVTLKADAVSVTDTSVQFSDGSQEEDIDVIVCTTGYDYRFPPLDGIIQLTGSDKDVFLLYLWTFSPSLKHPTLAVIGLSPEVSPVFPKLEMQCRWATRVFKGQCRLPDSKTMLREINGRRHDIVCPITYMDAMARYVGCKPSIVKLLLTDPRLGWHCYFGPATAYQYRLTGPGKWDGARDAILGTMERVLYPLNTRPLPKKVNVTENYTFLKVIITLVTATAIGLQWWRTNY